MLFSLALMVLNAVACLLLFWRGGVEDRLGAGLIIIATVAELVAAPLRNGAWAYGAAGVNLLLFLGLWYLSERYDRWWQFLSAVLQLAILGAHLIPVFSPVIREWTLVTIRLSLWSGVSLLLFLGVWEAASDRRFRRERAVEP